MTSDKQYREFYLRESVGMTYFGEFTETKVPFSNQVHVIEYAAFEQLKTDAAKLLDALDKIKTSWDISNPTRVEPAIESEIGPYQVRNDSVAAGSIISAIHSVDLFNKKWPEIQ